MLKNTFVENNNKYQKKVSHFFGGEFFFKYVFEYCGYFHHSWILGFFTSSLLRVTTKKWTKTNIAMNIFFYLEQKRPQLGANFFAINCLQNSYRNLPEYIQLTLQSSDKKIKIKKKYHSFLNFCNAVD